MTFDDIFVKRAAGKIIFFFLMLVPSSVEAIFKPVEQIFAHNEEVVLFIKMKDGFFASIDGSGKTNIWDAKDCSSVVSFFEKSFCPVSIVSLFNGLHVVAAKDYSLRIFDARLKTCQAKLLGHNDSIVSVIPETDNCFVSASKDGTIKRWDCLSRACIQTSKIEPLYGRGIGTMIELRSGLFMAGLRDGTLGFFDSASLKCLKIVDCFYQGVNALIELPDGRIVAAADEQKIKILTIQKQGDCLDVTDVQELIGHTSWIETIAPLGKDKLISASWDRTVKVWDLMTLTCLQTIRHSAFSPRIIAIDENTFFMAADNGKIDVYRAE